MCVSQKLCSCQISVPRFYSYYIFIWDFLANTASFSFLVIFQSVKSLHGYFLELSKTRNLHLKLECALIALGVILAVLITDKLYLHCMAVSVIYWRRSGQPNKQTHEQKKTDPGNLKIWMITRPKFVSSWKPPAIEKIEYLNI